MGSNVQAQIPTLACPLWGFGISFLRFLWLGAGRRWEVFSEAEERGRKAGQKVRSELSVSQAL